MASSNPDPSQRLRNSPKRLPLNPSEEHLKKQAKRRADADAVPLSEAQHRLACEYGCKNWPELMQLVEAMNRSANVPLMSSAGKPNQPLQAAARGKDMDAVRRLLDAGQFTQEELDAGLAGALWYGDAATQWPQMKAVADLLLDHGADPDGRFGDYGPIVFGTGECLVPESLQYLIDVGADVTFGLIDTKYGKQCPLSYWLGAYARGHNDRKHRGIDILLKHGAFIPPEVTPPILAIHRGDAKTLGELIDSDRSLIRRTFPDMPYGNIHLAGATLLHCAVEFDEIECIDAILSRYRGHGDLDINARAEVIGGVGGQTPIFHLINTGWGSHFATLKYIIDRAGQWLDMSVLATWRTHEGPRTTPVTPLEYAQEPGDEKWRKNKDAEIALLRPLDRRAAIRKACERGDVATVATMLDEHPDLLTPELWPPAYQAKSVEMTRLLLDRGLDPDISSAPRRAIDLAAYHALPDIVDLLIARGATVTSRNKLGETPLDLLDAYEPKPLRDPDSRRVREALLKAGAKHDLHTAVRAGDLDEVRRFLDADPPRIRGSEPTGPWPPLFTAARSGRVEVAKLLIDRGADVNEKNAKGNTALWFACQSIARAEDRLAVAKVLIDAGARVREECEDDSRAIHFAASRGPLALVELLIRHGARDHEPDKHGMTPLDHARTYGRSPDKDQIIALLDRRSRIREACAACAAGDVVGVSQLLDEHPDLLTPDLWPPAIFQGKSYEVTRLLLDRGLDPDQCSAPRKPLHLAADRGLVEIVRLLLERGAATEVVDGENITPLELVAMSKFPDGDQSLALLRAAGARENIFTAIALGDEDHAIELLDQDVSLSSTRGPIWFTPLDLASRFGRERVASRLLGMGAAVDSPNPADNTALWLACQSSEDAVRRIAVARLLLDAGADPSRRCEDGSTPLHFAAWRGPVEMVELLLSRGGDPAAKDDNGQTPADYARDSKVSEQNGIIETMLRRAMTAAQ